MEFLPKIVDRMSNKDIRCIYVLLQACVISRISAGTNISVLPVKNIQLLLSMIDGG